MKLLFLGAGGVGGYFGGRLVEAGADVTFLVRPARAERIARDGLRIRSPLGDARLDVRTVTRDSVTPDHDLVVLSPKAYDLDDAIETLAPAVGPRTCVLPLLNGLAHMDRLDARFGRDRVLGGVAQIGAMLDPDGVVVHLNPVQSLIAGGRDPATQAVAAAFVDCCRSARFDATLSPDIVASLWEKWTFLAALAGLTTLMRAPVGPIVAADHGDRLARAFHAECIAVAAAHGQRVSDDAQSRALGMLTRRGSPFSASMLRDLQSGQRTEHDHVLGDLITRGAARGVATPLLMAAHCQLQLRSAEREAAAGA